MRRLACAAALATAAFVATGSSVAPALGATRGARPALLPTTLDTSAGTWAALPMGRLGERLNTFWQLFFLPRGARRWVNRASKLGVATNGGLALASAGGSTLLVGTAPSNLLEFSPVARTSGRGTAWSTIGPAPGRVVALSGHGERLLAVVAGREGGRVLETTGAQRSGTWATLVSAHLLAHSAAGARCAPTTLTAAAFTVGGRPLVGGACARAGTVGLFAARGTKWSAAAVPLPRDAHGETVTVLRIGLSGEKTTCLLLLAGRDGNELLSAWSARRAGRWQVSKALPLGRSPVILSTGPVPGGQEFVLYRTGASRELRLALSNGPGRAWRALAAPPTSTATVAFDSTGSAHALAVHVNALTDWRLTPGASTWVKAQVAHVEIVFGSSQ